MISIGKIGVRSSGPAGSIVPGLSGGSGSPGRSGRRFTQWVGIRSSVSVNFVWVGHAAILTAASIRAAWSPPPARGSISLACCSPYPCRWS